MMSNNSINRFSWVISFRISTKSKHRASRGGASSYFATNLIIKIGMLHDWNVTSKHWNETIQNGIFHAAPRRPLKPAAVDESC